MNKISRGRFYEVISPTEKLLNNFLRSKFNDSICSTLMNTFVSTNHRNSRLIDLSLSNILRHNLKEKQK